MMPFRRLIVIALVFLSGCSLVKEATTQGDGMGYFVSVPITETSSSQIPCLNVEIEDKTLLVELDLGFRGHITVAREEVDAIMSKTFLGEKTMHGIRGKKYNKKVYRIPELKIGAMTFSRPAMQEDSAEFLKDAMFGHNERKTPSKEPGRLGWELFSSTNLLIDVPNARIVFSDSLDTLKKEGYATESFVKAPLFLERGLVEFESLTPNGPLRCMLDTGATWNALNEDVDKAIWTPENRVEYPFFQIEGIDFGPITFCRVAIGIPIRVEAILGMEFFQKHLVFLDFANKWVYFSKAQAGRRTR